MSEEECKRFDEIKDQFNNHGNWHSRDIAWLIEMLDASDCSLNDEEAAALRLLDETKEKLKTMQEPGNPFPFS